LPDASCKSHAADSMCGTIWSMDADLLRYLEGMEKRLSEHIDERSHGLENRLREYIDERMLAQREYIDERTHDSETRIVRAFGA